MEDDSDNSTRVNYNELNHEQTTLTVKQDGAEQRRECCLKLDKYFGIVCSEQFI